MTLRFASSRFGFSRSFTNMATGSAVIGTTLTAAGSAHTKGSWAQILAPQTDHIYFITLLFTASSTSATARTHLVDIGVDLAGGTSYSVLIPNLLVGPTTIGAAGSGLLYKFALKIPAGARIAARVQSNVASATVVLGASFYAAPVNPATLRYGTAVEAVGVSTAASRGTTYTNLGGYSLVSLTTGFDYIDFDFGFGIANATFVADTIDISTSVDMVSGTYLDGSYFKSFISRTTEDLIPLHELSPHSKFIFSGLDRKIPAGVTLNFQINFTAAFMAGGSLAMYGVY